MMKYTQLVLFVLFMLALTLTRPARADRWEAEDARLDAGIQVLSDVGVNFSQTPFSGTPSIRFDVIAPATDTYSITVRSRNSLDNAGSRTDRLMVNGVQVAALTPSALNVWEETNISISLEEGYNLIEIRRNWGGLDHDYLELPITKTQFASDPDPFDGQVVENISGTLTLSWANHSLADPANGSDVDVDVYFGTEPNDLVNTAGYGLPKVASRMSGNSLEVEVAAGNTYYWSVDIYDPNDGEETFNQGTLWSFEVFALVVKTRYQWEQGVLDGTTATSHDGRGTVFFSSGSPSSQITVIAPADGIYTVRTTFNNIWGSPGSRQDNLIVNDTAAVQVVAQVEQVWETFEADVTLNAGLNTIKMQRSWGGLHHDFIEVFDVQDYRATVPMPANDASLTPDPVTLSWINHSLSDLDAGSDVTCDVYLGTQEPNALVDPNTLGLPLIAQNIAANQLANVIVQPLQTYYWLVNCHAPVPGSSDIQFHRGDVWQFTTVAGIGTAARLEAEDGVLSPGVPFGNTDPNFVPVFPEIQDTEVASNESQVWFEVFGQAVTFDVCSPESKTYEMILGAYAPFTSKRVDVFVNDVQIASPILGNNVDQDSLETMSLMVNLNAGGNTVRVEANFTFVGIDYIEFPLIGAWKAQAPGPSSHKRISYLNDSLTLSWTPPEPLEQSSTITCDVFFGTADPNLDASDFGLTQIADDVSATSVPVPVQFFPLQQDATYNWVVVCRDSAATGPAKAPTIWNFVAVDLCQYLQLPGDLTFDCGVDIEDLLNLSGSAWTVEYTMVEFATIIHVNWGVCYDPLSGNVTACP